MFFRSVSNYFVPVVLLGLLGLTMSFAADKEDEDEEDGASYELTEEAILQRGSLIAEINGEYVAKLKPIFEKKCFDCHDSKRAAPWYAAVPGAKQLIEEHKEEAVEDFDMSNDFPFKVKSEGVIKGLRELAEVVEDSDMPPWSYLLVHWGSRLSKEEKQQVLDWTSSSIERLKSTQD